jgi:hypothetical protein
LDLLGFRLGTTCQPTGHPVSWPSETAAAVPGDTSDSSRIPPVIHTANLLTEPPSPPIDVNTSRTLVTGRRNLKGIG